MKNKLILILLMFTSIFFLVSCDNEGKKNYQNPSLDIEGNIVINAKDVTETPTFINYDADGTTVQLIAVKASDETIRLAFNTCQSCNPSPKAYFIQEDEYLDCQACGTKFKMDEVGITHGGCNPAPVVEKKESDDKIIISKDYVLSYKDKFENREGITK